MRASYLRAFGLPRGSHLSRADAVRFARGPYLNSHTPSDGCMLVTIPFMWRVVSVQRLCTATCSWPAREMSNSTVSEVKTANSVGSYAWMSCGAHQPSQVFEPQALLF